MRRIEELVGVVSVGVNVEGLDKPLHTLQQQKNEKGMALAEWSKAIVSSANDKTQCRVRAPDEQPIHLSHYCSLLQHREPLARRQNQEKIKKTQHKSVGDHSAVSGPVVGRSVPKWLTFNRKTKNNKKTETAHYTPRVYVTLVTFN